MQKLPRISDAEWSVMKVLWNRSPLTASEVIEDLGRGDEWHPKTVKTLLGRLVQKGALGYKKDGKAYLYRPLVAEDKCATAASEAFLSRVFSGSLKPMLAHFVEKKRLSAAELDELKKLLEDE
jgi:BlaI family penicillinase repressor